MKKKRLIGMIAVLCLAILVLSCTSCGGGHGKTLLTLEKDGTEITLSVNTYQLMQTRQKGLFSTAYDVTDSTFWEKTDKWNGTDIETFDEYWCKQILDNCRNYLIGLYLFEQKGLTLSEDALNRIESDLQELILNEGGGSKTGLNSILADYGVNYNILKDVYTMEEKINTLKAETAKIIGDGLKQSYMEEHYLHYKQIPLPFFTYVYEKDSSGEWHKKLKEDNTYETTPMTEEEKAAVMKEAQDLMSQLENCTDAEFDSKIAANATAKDLETDTYTDGYYICTDSKYSYDYINAVSEKLSEMQDGELAFVSTDEACFVIRKYAMTEKAWNIGVNADWFEGFENKVTEDFLLKEYQDYYQYIRVDEAVWATVPTMQDVKINRTGL